MRWKHRPEGSNWGDFGPDDQCGRLNLITPEKRLQGIAEVIAGETFCLSLPLDFPGGNYHALDRHKPQLRAVWRNGAYAYNLRPDPTLTDVWCDDVVTLATQGSTQWDALCHVGPGRYPGLQGRHADQFCARGRHGRRHRSLSRWARSHCGGGQDILDNHQRRRHPDPVADSGADGQ